MRRLFHYLLLAAFLVSAPTGCGRDTPETFPVSGTVRFTDGKPLTAGSVEFQTQELQPPVTAFGSIQPDGSFILTTYDANDGAVPGKHIIAVISGTTLGNNGNNQERPGVIESSELHPKYRQIKTSGIERTVKRGSENVFEIVVDYRKTP